MKLFIYLLYAYFLLLLLEYKQVEGRNSACLIHISIPILVFIL